MKLQWSKGIYFLNWNNAYEKVKFYFENLDQSDKGLWRLPNEVELKEYGKFIIDTDKAYWTCYEGKSSSIVYYIKGDSSSFLHKQEVRPTVFVRDVLQENQIEKKSMKLEWEGNPPTNIMNWYEAMEYAKSLDDGWRLPTIEELKEVYDSKLDGFRSYNYWSSTIADLDTLNAWYVNFSDGVGHYYYKKGRVFVRCVRDIPKKTVKEPFWEIKDVLQVQEKSALSDDYNLGLYNGMELCLSILEKREPKYKDLNPKKILNRYRIDVLQNSNKEINGMKYELEESGNWVQYNDIQNLVERQEYIISELRKLLRDVNT